MCWAALSILCGHWRYAHINAVRGDTLNPALLGMSSTVSEDVVRRAIKRMDESRALAWLSGELRACVEPVLSQPWIMDIDATIKTIYGHQQGAQLGYNPHKPGRPSHCYHSYFMANTRLCLGVEVMGGKDHASRHALPGLWSILDALARTHWPAMLRGDCGYARLYDGAHHREAITSRPALLGGVARLMRHGGQRTVKVSLQHENSAQLTQAIAIVSNTLHRFYAIAERWSVEQRWTLLLTHIFRHWLGGKWLGTLPAEANLLLSG